MSSELPDTGIGVREGDVLAGKYRVSGIIGSGGMGVVVAAHHIHLDEKVAIKVLHPDVIGLAEAVDRFIREARAVVKIKNDHVVRIIDVDSLPDGSPYMVMEYLEGLDLAEWIRQRGALEIEQAVEFVLQACEAVADAHALGIVHRDLKPSNLFCVRRSDGRPFVKVLDFGIYKAIGADILSAGPGITGTNTILGSPLYMSPEQMRASRDVDARTDIWSLGVILYELLCAHVPFDGNAVPEICVRVATQAPPALSAYRADIPPALHSVIDTCLQKDRNLRFANIAELATALAPYGPRRSREAAERIRRVLHVSGLSSLELTFPSQSQQLIGRQAPDTMAGLGYTSPKAYRKRVVKWSIGLGVVVMAAIAGAGILLKKRLPGTIAIGSSTDSSVTTASPPPQKVASSGTAAAIIAPHPWPSATSSQAGVQPGLNPVDGNQSQANVATTSSVQVPTRNEQLRATAPPAGRGESKNSPRLARTSQSSAPIHKALTPTAERSSASTAPLAQEFGGRL